MKDISKEIEINGVKYSLVFNLNVMEDLQNKYGSLKAWLDLVNTTKWEKIDIHALKYGLHLMFNEGIDISNENLPDDKKIKFLTERQVGRMITDEMLKKFNETIIDSTKIDDLSKNA